MSERLLRRKALEEAVIALEAGKEVPRLLDPARKVSRTAGYVCAMIGRISEHTARVWTIELALDGFQQEIVEEAARLVARTLAAQDIGLSALLIQARLLRDREKAIAEHAARTQLQDPDAKVGSRAGVVMGGIMRDYSAGLITATEIAVEYGHRYTMTDEAIEERRRELGAKSEVLDPTSAERQADERRAVLREQAAALEGA